MKNIFLILMLSCASRCFGTELINYAKIKGRETEFRDAIAKAESACGIKKSNSLKAKQSCILAYWIDNNTDKLLLEKVLVGIKTNDAQPQSRLIIAWRNILQYDSSWRAYTNDDVDYGAVVTRKNYLLSDHGFSRKEVEDFWKQSVAPDKADGTTLLDWLFSDNLQRFSNDKK
jgi:hypothetical protein